MLDSRGQVKRALHLRRPRFIASAISLALILTWIVPTAAQSAQSDLTVTVADAGIDSYPESGLETTPTLGVETFDSRALRSNATFDFSGDAGAFSGTGWIQSAGVYGGANSSSGTTGRHATANNANITLTMPASSDYRYVGFWWSGGNDQNYVDLILADGTTVGASFQVNLPNSTEDLAGIVGECGPNPPTNGYCGNPNYSPRAVPSELYAFVHLRYPPGFRQVRFSGAGFEFDNVTVSQTVPTLASTETTTETFNPFTLSVPSVLLADPRTGSINFPGVTLGDGSGETNAMLCFAEVTSGGANVSTVSLGASGSSSGITSTTDTNLRTFSGSRDDVTSFSSNIDIIPPGTLTRFNIVGSRYLRVTATPQTGLGSAGCTGDASVSSTIEVRFLNPQKIDSIDIQVRS